MLFNNFNNPDNIKNTLFLYYKNLINCLKNFNNQKITTYKTIDNFCKYLTDFKNQMKKKDKVLMLNEIINKEILRSKRLLLKLKFCNWIKNGKIIIDKISDNQKKINSNENAKIIYNSISFKEKYEYIEEEPINSGGYIKFKE